MDPIRRVEKMIEPALADMGFELVRVQLLGSNRPTLQIMAECADDSPMTVEHCAEISHTVSALLEVEDPVRGAYTLEVSSPGVDRPLVRPRDYERFAGYAARIEMHGLIDGQRRFQGRILGFADGVVRLDTKGGEMELPIDDIQHAKLVLTDELLAAAAAAS
ncbi:MAG: ribosome maturation factor RimP [Proteobacteria bacterium]|nr:ribosome maturation factor RimP [Pseudomonadota bacterium]